MKVLITGGYGFIGSFVAERFHKEGYDVYIIDNLSTGSKNNVEFKHKSYLLAVEDRKCEEIFRSNGFDIVVHLAAQVDVVTSMENPRLDTKSNILGLSNMLNLSAKYGVKKFIFASSAAVYGLNDSLPIPEHAALNPISPYGMNKMLGETYCAKWKEIYGLDTLCFRFSNVYGPRQGRGGEGGVVSIFMEHAITGKSLTVFGDGGQTRDFIYVEDVADAIYRSSYSMLGGVYNLSTNQESSVNRLIETLRDLHGDIQVLRKESRPGDIYRSTLDNSAIARSLDWSPKYDIGEGLARTYAWFAQAATEEQASQRSADAKSASPRMEKFALVKSYLENILAFSVLVWATVTLEDTSFYTIDLKLMYIIIIGILYGSRQSVIAVMLSVGLYVYQQLDNGRDMIALLYDTNFFFQTALYLFIGLIVGYSVERRNNQLKGKEHQLEILEEKHAFLSEVYDETRTVKEELQQQILNNGDSFGKLYSITKELESLEPEHIFNSTVSVVEEIMKTKSVTIHTVNKSGTFLRLAAHSNRIPGLKKSLQVRDYAYLSELLRRKQIFVNRELQSDLPLIAAPVVIQGEVIAVIALHHLDFERFSLYYENLFKTITELVSSALFRAHAYIEANGSMRYVEGTAKRVLRPETFADIRTSKKLAAQKNGVDYVLLAAGEFLDTSPQDIQTISESLRESDYLGVDEQGQLLILLSNSSKEEAAIVMNRLQPKQIRLRLVQEDLLYA
ncbi:NAD-dependent epimerase/dehydratase family protein [Paenibacillus methanolicus]|uniref:Nucleoside-diphosphate-sugar epimerase n=1 Tax=Paenibacillus methanolicus TaxID=582686 RepID=A0A5S5BST3_9BACL|nr:NAD-dependent epimerase/dehydratase family protein [Paenibacillus methanolicus]TYP68633.1 nucleoside-diphosphate-sugar epimerase [Paenibacillus methanolicus]